MKVLGILGLLFAVPPAGWVMLARQKWSWRVKVPMGIMALVFVVFHLMAVWGMRWQMLGGGTLPRPYFPRRESVEQAIERRAAEDRAALAKDPPQLPPVVETAQAVIPTAEPAAQPPAAPTVVSGYWPDFFGPRRDGKYTETPILTSWPSKGLEELWRRPVGGGYASMVVAAGLVFTIEQRKDREAAVAYDLGKGREVWVNDWPAHFKEAMGGDGPRATPTYSQGSLFVLGAEGELRCLNARDGKTIWQKNVLTDNGVTNLQWGMAGSPLLLDDSVIVVIGPVVAYDRRTGAKKWTSLQEKGAYVAPMTATLAGVRQIVAMTAERVVGLVPSTGKLLWEFPWKTEYDVNGTMPTVVGPNRLILSSGYGHGSALIEINGSGDSLAAKEIWQNKALKNKFNTQVASNGVVYGLDEGILVAVEVNTGERKWKGGRYGYGQLLLAGDHLIVLTEGGEVVLVRAIPDRHEEVARFQAIEGKTWNVPALAGGRLLVRNTTEMACYRIAP